jgi:hypothetical protein
MESLGVVDASLEEGRGRGTRTKELEFTLCKFFKLITLPFDNCITFTLSTSRIDLKM